MVNDLQSDDNSKYRLFQRFSLEADAVSIAKASLITSVLFSLLALWAHDSAKEANVRSEMQTEKIEKLEGLVETYSNRTIRWETWMKSKGIQIEEIHDE